jgi:hypothetical protein
MLPFQAIRLAVLSAFLRYTGRPGPGRSIVRALSSKNETVRTMAGMMLEKAGARAVPVVREALGRGVEVPTLLLILGDIGAPSERVLIEPYAASDDPNTATGARDALRILALREQLGSQEGYA